MDEWRLRSMRRFGLTGQPRGVLHGSLLKLRRPVEPGRFRQAALPYCTRVLAPKPNQITQEGAKLERLDKDEKGKRVVLYKRRKDLARRKGL